MDTASHKLNGEIAPAMSKVYNGEMIKAVRSKDESSSLKLVFLTTLASIHWEMNDIVISKKGGLILKENFLTE
jgi:hypothetical protein